MMTVEESIAYINDFTWSTTHLGLERTFELLEKLGNPHKRLKFLHVAGTNGKGSTCAMLEAILRSAGYTTGMYPSPYIEDFCERIQVNGEMITHEAIAELTPIVAEISDAMEDHPSQFEIITAIGMLYFEKMGCDIVILEVGMGGALDSTNVIDAPEAAIITNIGLDHTEYLGDTIEKIAATKGGIIKKGTTAVSYANIPSVMEVLQGICADLDVPLHTSDGRVKALDHSLDGQRFIYYPEGSSEGVEYTLALLGNHQLKNAATVLTTIDVMKQNGWQISEEAIREGLRTVKWPARFEVLGRDPVFILDGGHNPQCAEALAEGIEAYLLKPGAEGSEKRIVTFLIGMLADKDYRGTLDLIRPFGKNYVCVTPENPRALKAPELAEAIRSGIAAEVEQGTCEPFDGTICSYADFSEAIDKAIELGGPIVAFGSLYSAGTIRGIFRRR